MPTKIEWSQETWNPVTGCDPVSAGCLNCYAKRMANRLRGRFGYPQDEPFRVTVHPDRLETPLRWRKPRRVFVCSMGDLFHDDVPEEFIRDVLHVCESAMQHTFLLLTKRPERMRELLREWAEYEEPGGLGMKYAPMPNLWTGVSVENQETAIERIPILNETPAAVRFISYEPALGSLDLTWNDADWPLMLDWVIAGGETGPNRRPVHPDWMRAIRDQCDTFSIPFFFKGWGDLIPRDQAESVKHCKIDYIAQWAPGAYTQYMSRQRNGHLKVRTLDGKLHEEYPQ